MESRLDYPKLAPGGYRAMLGLETYVSQCGLEPALLELIKIRASQINGCAYCLDMHTKDARVLGESEQRIYALDAWRETPFYSERERAALAWTESVTLIGRDRVPDATFEEVSAHFNEMEVVNLTWAIVTINSWNRVAIAMRSLPGSYEPAPRSGK